MYNNNSSLVQPFNWLMTTKHCWGPTQNQFFNITNKRSVTQVVQNKSKSTIAIGVGAIGIAGLCVLWDSCANYNMQDAF
jgi:hypothetical protein